MNKLFSQFFMTAILLHFFAVGAFSQTLTSKEWKKLRESDDCIIGMGMSESMDHARQVAMADLGGNILADLTTIVSTKLENHQVSSDKANSASEIIKESEVVVSQKLYSPIQLIYLQ